MENQRPADVVKANLYLFNMLFRHQVYLEGVKAGLAPYFRRMLMELYAEFAKYFGQAQYDKLDAFSRAELQRFIYRFQQAQAQAYNRYTQQLISILKDFVSADIDVTHSLFLASRAQAGSQHIEDQPQKPNADLLWAAMQSKLIGANGLTIGEMLKQFGQAQQTKIAQRINIGYANGESVFAVRDAILGTKQSTFRDGMFSVFANQSDAVNNSALQFTSASVQIGIAAQSYPQDEWVSILDSKTTPICRERNGEVFAAGEGPYPPAHYNCRSKRVSLVDGETLHDVPNSFSEWAVSQPNAFLLDALGASFAAKLLGNEDISINDAAKPLTLDGFKDKINFITM